MSAMNGRRAAALVAVAAAAASAVAGVWGGQGPSPDQSPATLALGDSVFHGKVGGALCYVCHGPAAKGVPGLGPDLTDKEWLNADGTVESIAKVVETGVPKPKKLPAPMPPKGGGQLNAAQVKAAAAYVYSLSHPAK
ncbi:MAG: c-type cytochrome [Gemmataceae bacterium]|nr:c-type cytochrome [Gemmataceae bacterium]